MKKCVILCVDDEKIVLDSLRVELKSAFGSNVQIELAESGTEALELLKEYTTESYEFPVIITDYIMPEMKGDELLREIKDLYPKIYTIMLTGQATTEGVGNAVNWANLYRYIPKPWETTDLILTVKEALKSYFKDKEIDEKNIELEVANERLTRLDNAKSYFLGLLSHELNTPLNAIYGNAQLIKAYTEDEEILESADYIITASNRLKRFNDISLLITQIRTQKYEISFKEISVKEVLDLAVFNQSTFIQEKGISIERDLNYPETCIKGDHELLYKILEIIINNACKFSPINGEVRIEDAIKNNQYIIKIMDRGEGFTQQSLNHLFEFFSSGELLHHSEGFGLGLAAVKIIMEVHRGQVNAYNAPDGGAVVDLVFDL